ncbi:MAG TPA: hypothetical protein PK954_16280 [Anaerolineales bacterium]|nr:hypothetical protein [Anaerolineales bacterium]HRF46546.1 hypothetical protein [Anaerolineales bacterium]
MSPYTVNGIVIAHNGHFILVYGSELQALGAPVIGAPVELRPGYRLWEAPTYLLPQTVIDDIGQEFVAPDVYDWIEERGDLYPRSEAYGCLPDGKPAGYVIKALDLTQLRAFAGAPGGQGPYLSLSLAIEAEAVPDDFAVTPVACPVPLLARALPTYRLAPGTFGAIGAAILNQLLNSRRRDFQLTFDELDDMLGDA